MRASYLAIKAHLNGALYKSLILIPVGTQIEMGLYVMIPSLINIGSANEKLILGYKNTQTDSIVVAKAYVHFFKFGKK